MVSRSRFLILLFSTFRKSPATISNAWRHSVGPEIEPAEVESIPARVGHSQQGNQALGQRCDSLELFPEPFRVFGHVGRTDEVQMFKNLFSGCLAVV